MQPSRRRRALTTALAALGIALVAPASAGAAVTIGGLDTGTANTGCEPNRIYVQNQINPASTDTYTVPAGGGVITSWSTRPDATAGQQGTLKVVRKVSTTTYTVLATSPLQALTPSVVNTFPVRIPVTGGELIGYGVPAGGAQQACFDTNTNSGFGVDNGADPTPGTTLTTTNNTQRRLNLTAAIEPDADRDGFGDESQDRCPGVNGPVVGCPQAGTVPPVDRTKPSLTDLGLTRTRFRAAGSGSAFTTQKRRRRTPVGTRVAFTLSEPASVRFTVQRKTTGRRSGGKCRTRTRANRRRPKCTLWKSARGSFTVQGKAGDTSLTFRGRIGGRKLSAGSYRLVATATDPAKNVSAAKTTAFRIVRR